MSDMPRFILRNCSIFVDGQSQIGQAKEITLPVPTEKTEELRNAGMIMPIAISMGYDKLETSFKLTSFDPAILGLQGLKIGVINNFMVTGALVHEDGTVTAAVAYIQGRIYKQDSGSWKPGEVAECDYGINVRYYKLEIGGREVLEVTPFKITVNGVSQTDEIRQALYLI